MALVPHHSCTFKSGGDLIAPYITWCYKSSTFCDLVLIGSGDQKVQCHKMVMCSLSQRLHSLCSAVQDTEDTIFIHLPQFTHQEVKCVVDRIYSALDQGKVEFPIDEVITVLGIQSSPLKLNRRDEHHSDKDKKVEEGDDIDAAKLEDNGFDDWEIECDPDLVKSEQTVKDEDWSSWAEDTEPKVRDQHNHVDEEEAQGCLNVLFFLMNSSTYQPSYHKLTYLY